MLGNEMAVLEIGQRGLGANETRDVDSMVLVVEGCGSRSSLKQVWATLIFKAGPLL